MEKCHEPCVAFMKKFLGRFWYRKLGRALEAACGDGRVTKDLLLDEYSVVDLFDLCPKAIDIVNRKYLFNPKVVHIDCCSM